MLKQVDLTANKINVPEYNYCGDNQAHKSYDTIFISTRTIQNISERCICTKIELMKKIQIK